MRTSDIALIGAPNSGKTSFINRLTGGRLKVANYPGVTVDVQTAVVAQDSNSYLKLIDLPGLYSLIAKSPDEQISVRYMDGHISGYRPELVLAVVDTTNLYRSLRLALEVKAKGLPVIGGLSMLDEAAWRGQKMNWQALSENLGIELIPLADLTVARLATAIDRKEELASQANNKLDLSSSLSKCTLSPLEVDERSAKIDRWLLSPVIGGMFFFLSILLSLQLILDISEYPIAILEQAFEWLSMT